VTIIDARRKREREREEGGDYAGVGLALGGGGEFPLRCETRENQPVGSMFDYLILHLREVERTSSRSFIIFIQNAMLVIRIVRN